MPDMMGMSDMTLMVSHGAYAHTDEWLIHTGIVNPILLQC
jgi:hypothetical protein